MEREFGRRATVKVERVAIFLRGETNELLRVAGLLSSGGVSLETLGVTRAASCNLLHVVTSSARGTLGILDSGNIVTAAAGILTITIPGIANKLAGLLRVLTGTGISLTCVCSVFNHSSNITCVVLRLGGSSRITALLGDGKVSITAPRVLKVG